MHGLTNLKKKLCNVASCWICIGILIGAHYILHISRIRVKEHNLSSPVLTTIVHTTEVHKNHRFQTRNSERTF